ncbi:MAG: response regulator [Deltaproteobacteria bacterium]|nr:response regulator [Deltaproteobacteria bacterium]
MLQLLAQASEPHPNQPIIIGLLIAMGLVLVAIIALLVARGRQAKRIAVARMRAEQAQHEVEEQAKRQADERAQREAEELAQHEAAHRAEREAEERAEREVEAQLEREAEEEAKREAEERAQREAQEAAQREADERGKQEAKERAERQAADQAQRQADEQKRRNAEVDAKRIAEERAKVAAEERAKRAAEERAKREIEERARRAAQVKAKQAGVTAPTPTPLGDMFKVLLVEDSVTMHKIVEQTLSAENCEVVVVTCGNDALAKARELKPQLVIADLTLDDKDGYSVCQEIRKDGALAHTPVLLLQLRERTGRRGGRQWRSSQTFCESRFDRQGVGVGKG